MLVKILIVKRLLFKNVTIIPNGKTPKMFRTKCNVPADTVVVMDLLSYSACSKGIAYIMIMFSFNLLEQCSWMDY